MHKIWVWLALLSLFLAASAGGQSPDLELVSPLVLEGYTQEYRVFWTMSDGTPAVQLTDGLRARTVWGSWSPDGTRIAFEWGEGSVQEIWVMNADGTNPINLARNTPDAEVPLHTL